MVEKGTENQGLQVIDQSPSKALIFSLIDIREVLDPFTVSIIKEHPVAVQIAQAFAYEYPGLIELGRKKALSSDLQEIRKNFPRVITHFTDDVLSQVLLEHSYMDKRLVDEREILNTLPEDTRGEVKDIELILKLLIEDGKNRNLNIADYENVERSSGFFTALITSFENSGDSFDQYEEQNNCTQIGQRLLKTKLLFEVRTEELDLEYSRKNQKTGEGDFKGLEAQMALISRIAGVCRDSRDPALVARARVLKTDAQSVFDDIYRRHLGRLPEIHRKYPELVGISDFPWAEHPGGPDLTRAEQRDTTNGGNNYH